MHAPFGGLCLARPHSLSLSLSPDYALLERLFERASPAHAPLEHPVRARDPRLRTARTPVRACARPRLRLRLAPHRRTPCGRCRVSRVNGPTLTTYVSHQVSLCSPSGHCSLYVSSRRPLVAPLGHQKREMPEVGSLGARAPEKEEDVDNAPARGYQPQAPASCTATRPPDVSRRWGAPKAASQVKSLHP